MTHTVAHHDGPKQRGRANRIRPPLTQGDRQSGRGKRNDQALLGFFVVSNGKHKELNEGELGVKITQSYALGAGW